MSKRVGGHHPVAVPKSVAETKGATKPHAAAEAKKPVDTQQIAAAKPAGEVAEATANVPDTLRFVKQSLEQLDRELLLVPQPLKMQLADSLRGYGGPPAGAEGLADKAHGVFDRVEAQIDKLSTADKAQLFGVLTIPYDTSNPDGETARMAVQPPGMAMSNMMMPGQNPMLGGAAQGMPGQRGPNGQPLNALNNPMANTMPMGNPMMMGAQTQNVTDPNPTNPMELLKEVVVQRLAYAARGNAPPLYAIDWQNPLGSISDAAARAAAQGATPVSVAGGTAPRDIYATSPSPGQPPVTTLSAQSRDVVGALAAGGVTKQGLSQLASALASDMAAAFQWGLTPLQFTQDVAPLLDWLKLHGKAQTGAGGAVLVFNARLSSAFDPQSLQQLAAQLASM